MLRSRANFTSHRYRDQRLLPVFLQGAPLLVPRTFNLECVAKLLRNQLYDLWMYKVRQTDISMMFHTDAANGQMETRLVFVYADMTYRVWYNSFELRPVQLCGNAVLREENDLVKMIKILENSDAKLETSVLLDLVQALVFRAKDLLRKKFEEDESVLVFSQLEFLLKHLTLAIRIAGQKKGANYKYGWNFLKVS